MIEVVITTVEMPLAENVRKVAEIRRKEINRAYREARERAIQKAEEDFPNFLAFVNEKIAKASHNGLHSIKISFDDEYFFSNAKQDKRCLYRFKGLFTYQLANKLEEIYKQLGFSCYCKDFCSSTYRVGYIEICW
jgi:hypothetical protein